jgi:hypothetical protein
MGCNKHNKNSPWYKYGIQFGFPNVFWSEPVCGGYLATPINTISNVFYLIAGYFMYATNPLVAGALSLVGVSSGLYHCSVIYPFQLMDISSMSLTFTFMLKTQLNLSIYTTMIVFLLNKIHLWYLIRYKRNLQYNSLLNILLILLSLPHYNIYILYSVFSLITGVSCSYVDLAYKYVYGHSMWHLFSALAVYLWNMGILNISLLK